MKSIRPRALIIPVVALLIAAAFLTFGRKAAEVPSAPTVTKLPAEVAKPVAAKPGSGKTGITVPGVPETTPKGNVKTLRQAPEKVLKSILLKHRQAVAKHGPQASSSRFQDETMLFHREARLLALAYPKEVEPLASKLALDKSSDQESREFGIYILAILASKGNEPALNALLTVVQDPAPGGSLMALAGVSMADDVGRFKSIYLAKCGEGNPSAFFILSRWLDQATINEMRRQLETPNARYAEEVLRRMDVLADPRCDERLESIVRHKADHDSYHAIPWALRLLRARDPRRLKEALRSELDKTFNGAKAFWDSVVPEKDFESAYVSQAKLGLGKISWAPDYDDYLINMLEAGGKVTEIEKARLRTFGYGCDPETRLVELLEVGADK